MRFLTDECCDAALVDALRDDGHDVLYAIESLRGATDDDILARHDRIEAIGQGVQAMGDEEAYYWFSKCSAGPDALRAQKALRILLAGE